jgi:hypothetical protein
MLVGIASAVAPVVARNGICTFLPCDPAPPDVAVGLTADGIAQMHVHHCARSTVQSVRVLQVGPDGQGDPAKTVWAIERSGHATTTTFDVGGVPTGYMSKTVFMSPPTDALLVADVSFRGVDASTGFRISELEPDKVRYWDGLHSLADFERQARPSRSCVEAAPGWERALTPIGLLLILCGLLALLVPLVVRRVWQPRQG